MIPKLSAIGPRPALWSQDDLIEEREKYGANDIKPGITGAWQVSGRSKITNFEEVVQLDVDYIKHWTLLTDLRIILKTIKVVVEKQGADNR